MAYGIGRAHKLGGETESDLITPHIFLKHLQPLHIVTTGLLKTLTQHYCPLTATF